MRNLTAREVLRLLKDEGWYEVGQRGSHLYLEHQDRPGKVTVVVHKGRTLKPGTLNSILKHAGLKGKQGG